MPPPPPSLTSRLLSSQTFSKLYPSTTQSPFLRLAGTGRLPLDVLSEWLSQDRLYAQAYVRFIGGLISKVELPVETDMDAIEWKVLNLLKSALEGIMTELGFFEEMAGKYSIDLQHYVGDGNGGGGGANEATRKYIELFDSFHRDKDKGLVEGMVLLWATERVYLDAWRWAGSFYENNPEAGREGDGDMDGGALRKGFIPNWTSEGFVGFVEEIEGVVNQLAASYGAKDDNEGDVETMALGIWGKVLDLEKDFWPVCE